MSKPERVLILTLSFGEGHVAAARALADEFSVRSPGSAVRTIDVLKRSSMLFRSFYAYPYWLMIRHAPRAWKWFFASRTRRHAEFTAPEWAWIKGCREVFSELKSFRPDLIVACEVGACEVAAIAARKGMSRARIANVITDLEAEPIWAKQEIETYFVPNKTVREQLISWGAKADSIRVSGIPLKRNFANLSESSPVLGESDGRPIILLMGGGMGPTRMDQVARALLHSSIRMQVVALPGKDRAVKQRLERFRAGSNIELTIVDWTDDVAGLMRAASILVTKPGGVTLAEASVLGVPMVLFDTIPGPEEINAEIFVKHGAAVMANSPEQAAREVESLLADHKKLIAMRASAFALGRPNSTRLIVDNLLGGDIEQDRARRRVRDQDEADEYMTPVGLSSRVAANGGRQ